MIIQIYKPPVYNNLNIQATSLKLLKYKNPKYITIQIHKPQVPDYSNIQTPSSDYSNVQTLSINLLKYTNPDYKPT